MKTERSLVPESVPLEEEGAVLNGHRLGLHKQQPHQNGLHNHTASKEEEGAPLHGKTTEKDNKLLSTMVSASEHGSAGQSAKSSSKKCC